MASDLSESLSEAKGTAKPIAIPVRRRELLAIVFWTILADLLIYRTFGFSGPALFFALVPILFLIAYPRLDRTPLWYAVAGLLVTSAIRLAWSGSSLAIVSAFALVVGLAMVSAGSIPYVLEAACVAGLAFIDGAKRISKYRISSKAGTPKVSGAHLLGWVLPALAAIVFGSIFIFANPNLLDRASSMLSEWSHNLQYWLSGLSFWEIPFCILALLLGAGLIRPALPLPIFGPVVETRTTTTRHEESPLYIGARNSLITLVTLFGIYLVFEFMTLWISDFPPGFYYAGYAHQGAAWLTFALALATGVLSLVFAERMLSDTRVDTLRRLAWIWSAQNLLLAAAVYNRCAIYVGYNGMTQLRTVAFFGITLVVIGFCLVVLKIHRNRGFWWLIRGQLIAFVLTIIAYSLFPVDYVAHRYNANAVRSGYLHPSVMIAVKDKNDEGLLPLFDLLECDDPIIREGVTAILAERKIQLEQSPITHWTEFQGARATLRKRLRTYDFAEFESRASRDAAIATFRNYAMQWY
ncbi:MAG: DUF4153 domain-containing protein [Rubripirellula sp.]